MSVIEQLRQLEAEATRQAWAAYNAMIREPKPSARRLRDAGAQVGRDVAAIERDLAALERHRGLSAEIRRLGTPEGIEADCQKAIARHEEALVRLEEVKAAVETAADGIRQQQDRGARRERLEKQLAELEAGNRSVFPVDPGPGDDGGP